MISLPEVKDIARRAHMGQRDKLDRDYYHAHLEPIAAALAPLGVEAEMAGWLHDILEDTEVTSTQLRAHGVPEPVIRAVESVSKRPDEAYEDLIGRAAADPLGRYVKLADNALNLESNPALAAVDPAKAERLREKYTRARAVLLASITDDDRPRRR